MPNDYVIITLYDFFMIHWSKDMKDINVAKGLKKIIIAQYFAIVATMLLGSTSLLLAVFEMSSFLQNNDFYVLLVAASLVIGFVFTIAISISVIFNFFGYFQAAKDEPEFKKAMICAIVVGVLSVIGFFFQIPNGTLHTIFNSASTIFEMFVMIFSLSGLINISANHKRADMAEAGDKLLKILVITFIISSIDSLVIRIFELSSHAKIVSIIIGIIDFALSIIQYVLYIRYLTQSLKMLKTVDGE